ncbi:hypothetical protein BDR22DRAFT_821604 [Usnea florida]
METPLLAPPLPPLCTALDDITEPSRRASESGKSAPRVFSRIKANLVNKERLKTPTNTMLRPTQATVARSDNSNHVTHGNPNRENYDLLTGSYKTIEREANARFAYHQPASAMGGSSREQEDVTPLRATSRIQRQNLVDPVSPSRGKMWDPVKDCRHSNVTQAQLPIRLPAGHERSDVFKSPTINTMPSMYHHSYHGEHPYGQAQGNRHKLVCPGNEATPPLGVLPSAPTNATTLGYQKHTSMNSQPFHVTNSYNETAAQPYDQFGVEPSKLTIQRGRQHQSVYENGLSLPAYLRHSSEQNENQASESLTKRAASMGKQPPQGSYLNGLSSEIGQQFADMESGRLITMGSTERCPDLSTFASQAFNMANNAERLDQQSNFKEAVRAYEQACVLFQGVINRSSSVEERMSYGHARDTYQARRDELLRELAASPTVTRGEEENEHEDDSIDRGKPSYTLLEDLALCHRDEEDLSWQEIAEKPIFKGKRKHRSLSQRKHSITKMGPKYHEPEIPWTEEEDIILCAMGDAGKSLGDIHRKFRSRNAERCLKRYFHLKGQHTTGSNDSRTSQQLRQASARHASSALNIYSSSIGAVVDRVHPSESASQRAPASGWKNPSLFM